MKSNAKKLNCSITTSKKIGIITYNNPHLKTAQILAGLLAKDEVHGVTNKYAIYALPFVERKIRSVLFTHRPKQNVGEKPSTLASRYGMKFVKCRSDKDIDNACDIYIIGGARILSPECVADKLILNCHPGSLSSARGLDAFKWAIYNGTKVRNTLYYITADVDHSDTGAEKETPVYETDTLRNFADRHYASEIEMLVNFDCYEQTKLSEMTEEVFANVNSRMPIEIEQELELRFVAYKDRWAKEKKSD
ncbi:MAG: hypothetical protein LBM77_10885 [Spirochaetaceae bacterium]|jgi:phosphoribosylglycinamide formyltransferase-1|nr:hypothetical protein [Spirochaetaceae bacterium]